MIGIMKMNFDELSLKYKEKNIVKLSKKLANSFALTRSKDMTNLHDLAFWLYIYDYKDEILNIYNLVNIDIPLSADDYFLLKKYFKQYPAPLHDNVQDNNIFKEHYYY